MPNVLIVDDEQSIRITVREFLLDANYKVGVAADAPQAIAMMAAEDFDVVLADIILPQVTGMDLLKTIKEASPLVQVILMTGEPTVETASEAVRGGAFDYLRKPIGKEQLLRAVANAAKIKELDADRRRLAADNVRYRENLERLVEERTAALQESEARARALTDDVLDTSAVGIFILDSQFKVVWINQAIERHFGLRREDVVGKDKRKLIHGRIRGFFENPEEFCDKVLATYDNNTYAENFECRVLPDGDRKDRWLEHSSQPIRFGLYAGGRIEHYYDITERKRAETELRQSATNLARAQEIAKIGNWSWDIAENKISWSDQYYRIVGLDKEEFAANYDAYLSCIHPDDLELFKSTTAGVLKEKKAYSIEYRIVRPNHDIRIVHERGEVGVDTNGNAVNLFGTIQDITERKEAEKDRERLEEKLRHASKMETVGTLAAGVAHDFNNTLTAILGYTEVARLLLPEKHEARQALDGIMKAGKQGSRVTKSLLTFSRSSVGERLPVEMGMIVTDSIAMLRPMLPAAIELVTEASSSGDLWVEGDAAQLQQVVVNLAVNASDAMPAGGQIRLSLDHHSVDAPDAGAAVVTRGKGLAKLVVEDGGSGMSEEVRSRIFEPFFTSKERGQGTGLGMAIVHGIVSEHGGHIEVESAEGKGTRVSITIPCCDPSDTRTPRPSDQLVAGARGETLILAEDNRLVRAVIATTLGNLGYNVVQASNGDEALCVFNVHESSARLLILDQDLPNLSGVACLRRIRDHHPEIPAIIISGLLGLRNDDIGENVVLLRKPFEMSDLAALVGRMLEDSRANRGLEP